VSAGIEKALTEHRTVLAAGDEVLLARWQFGQPSGSDADLVAHWSVMRGDPAADTDRSRESFAEPLSWCKACPQVEAAQAEVPR
jgi:hypothetical protein